MFKSNRILIVSLLINFIVIVIFFTPLVQMLYKPLIYNEPLRKSEVIIILSAGVYNSGLPDFRTLSRMQKGLDLYRKGIADTIICAGGVRLESNASIAEIMKDRFILYGIPPRNIFIQDETTNTYNDITFLLNKFKDRFDFNRAVFVTSSYHTYRVKKILEKKRINALVVSAESYELYPQVWSEKLDLFREIIREYLAICYLKANGFI